MSSTRYFNRQNLRKLSKQELIVIPANVPVQKTMDQAYTFKQDNNFWYLTGIDEPSFILVISGEDEFLIAPKQSSYQETFDGKPDFSELTKASGIKQILDHEIGWQKLGTLVKSAKSLATYLPSKSLQKYYGIYNNPGKKVVLDKIKRLNPKTEFIDETWNTAGFRSIKLYPEIVNIEKAVAITVETLKEALNPVSLKSLKTAKELEAIINFGFVSRGATGPSFDPIIAQGKKATTIHYTKNDQELNNKDLLLIDVGCEYNHYCSDISRTISLSKPTNRQQSVFNSVKYVQEELVKTIKAGITWVELEEQSMELVGRELLKLKLIKDLDKKQIRKYYPHSVSHSLGLDVHDLTPYGAEIKIPKNAVITVEPGIYIPEESIAVRIEDDVLVEEGGCKVLSASLPKELMLQ